MDGIMLCNIYAPIKEDAASIKRRADIVALLHFFWLVLIITSLPFVLIWNWYTYSALASIGLTVGSWLVYGDCPLFAIENRLRRKYNVNETFSGSFLSHYLHKYFYIEIPTPVVTFLGYAYAAVIIIVVIFKRG